MTNSDKFIALELVKSKLSSRSSDEIMLDGNMMSHLFDFLTPDILNRLIRSLEVLPPPLMTPEFGVWVKFTRINLGISQQAITEATKVSQGDLSRLERNIEIGPQVGEGRRTKIRSFLLASLKLALK